MRALKVASAVSFGIDRTIASHLVKEVFDQHKCRRKPTQTGWKELGIAPHGWVRFGLLFEPTFLYIEIVSGHESAIFDHSAWSGGGNE